MSDPYRNPFEPERPPERPVHPLEQVKRSAAEAVQRPAQPVTGPVQRIRLPLYSPVVLTYVLFGLNIAVFLVDLLLGRLLTEWGAKVNEALVAGQYWRFFTPMFLHGGLLHLGFNSYFLYIFGPDVERRFGLLRFAGVYLLGGFGGVLLSFALGRYPSLGASGALFGIVGGLLVYFLLNRDVMRGAGQAQVRGIIGMIAINLLIGFAPGSNIDNWGHIGGLLAGMAAGYFLSPRYEVKGRVVEGTSPVLGETAYIDYNAEDTLEPANAYFGFLLVSVLLGACAVALLYLRGGLF